MRARLPAALIPAAAVCAALLAVLVATDAPADHSGGLNCYACHTFNAGIVQPGTTSMSIAAMTEMKQHGWPQGQRLACTFCHRSSNAPAIPDVMSNFTGPWASRHPAGRNFVTQTADNSVYLSNDNTHFAQSLDCLDCHDVTLTSYPNHDNVTWLNDSGTDNARKKSTNPYGLRSVSQPKAYDDLCRNCHRSLASFNSFTNRNLGSAPSKLLLVSHDNGADGAANAIRDLDNTPLRTQSQYFAKRQCTVCHDAHYSGNGHLFSDGHELDPSGLSFETGVEETTDCTNVCHYRGDAAGSYDTHGHGKSANWKGTAINLACTDCHSTSAPHNRNEAEYANRYRFSSIDNAWVEPRTVFGNPPKSVCGRCHSTVPLHRISRTINGSQIVGCIDCHDQHAKNSDNNVMMIPSTNNVAGSRVGVSGIGASPGTEAVRFQKSEKYPAVPADNVFDYFSKTSYGSGDPANPGFCDQRACHGAGYFGGVPFTPLDNYLASGKHSGSNQTVNSDCEACHKHTDIGGSFRASSSCTLCHGQPPPTADNSPGAPYPRAAYEGNSPHPDHVGSGYPFDCKYCHVYYTDNNYHNTTATGKTFQSVFFSDNVKRTGGTAAYDNSLFTCAYITCHSDGRNGAPNVTPRWFDPANLSVKQTLDCAGCHDGATGGTRMSSGAHTIHLNNRYACSACHVNTVQDDNVTLAGATGYANHVNSTRNVTIKAAYDNDGVATNNWSAVDNTCSGVTCHGNNRVGWYAPPGSLTCASCHVRTGDVEDFGNGTQASMTGNSVTAGIDNAEWMESGHGRDAGQYDISVNSAANLRGGGGTGTNKCAFCHSPAISHDNAANPFRLANYNVFATGWNGNCYVCHAAAAVGDSSPGYDPPDDGTGTYGAKTATQKVESAHFNARHDNSYNGGRFCFDCHDPHGERAASSGNIFMIRRKVSMRTDNVYGIPAGGTAGAGRRDAVFTNNVGGASYASIDNVAPFTGICETCHETASSITHFPNSGPPYTAHFTGKCTDCHTHDSGFRGVGGQNIEQFFDNAYRASSSGNYNDMSRHPIRTDNVLAFGSEINCYSCHGVAGSTVRSNECLKCHWENRPAAGTPTHPNGKYEWATPSSPATKLYEGAVNDNSDTLCLACHNGGALRATLGNPAVNPGDIFQPLAGETSWTGPTPAASGHGSTARLSGSTSVGPPQYHCSACHYSSIGAAGGQARDNTAAGFHASANRKLVRNDNVAGREYPHPTDGGYNADQKTTRMDQWCATMCHRNSANGIPRDDNVVDHTWSVNAQPAESRSGSLTHPTNFTISVGALYKLPVSLPLSDNLGVDGGTQTGNAVCVTCHNPHGGGDIRNSGGAAQTGGAKNMLRLSPADNTSTLCKECHK